MSVETDPDGLAAMYPDWDRFVGSFAHSPFFLLDLLRTYLVNGRAPAKHGHRFAAVLSEGGKPVGLAAFRLADSYIFWKPRLFKFRSAKFVLPDFWSPDFVAEPEHKRQFVEMVMSLLFDRLGCSSATLALPSESPSVPLLLKWCTTRGMAMSRSPGVDHPRHAMLSVQGTWDDFLSSREKNFVRRYLISERRLDRAGRWGVTFGKIDSQDVVDKILEVDRRSWKQKWRDERRDREWMREWGADTDEDLVRVLDFYRFAPTSEFCPIYWLLELDNRPISFCVAIIMGGVAYLIKASYDEQYRRFSPGTVLLMRAFRQLFESKAVSRIEFFTFYDYMQPWTSEKAERETFLIENHRGAFKLLMGIRRSMLVRQVWHRFNP
jgi:hypothetical protein